ncbi:RdgB/HAM1 family non-canonical purine NTP pyrophosphatase [Rubritalea tangerina]|uniref:dITP/XTP pyrophosphatase n=1 Tax=Rubritalea tangerina TaxID=430798 RepID=A0ABW4ZF95_9BACT
MSSATPILIATGNSHKTEEIGAILGSQFSVSDLNGKNFPKVDETGTTFLENATLKAVEISKRTDAWVLSDDSGLEVDALNGEPGVYSARYAGEEGNDAANNAKLLNELGQLPADTPRSARFRCVIVLAKNGQRMAHFSGAVEGRIIDQLTGNAGFGYDPLFIPEGHEATFAQLPSETKNSLSHRARALAEALPWIEKNI